MKKILLSTIFCIASLNSVFSQHIEGKVIDEEGTPLIDAYIFKNNGTIHAHTNELGVFYCDESSPGDTLNISYLGFDTKSIVLAAKDFDHPVTIVLQERKIDLGQVVVSNSIRSVNQISKIDLTLNPVNSSQEILRKVPGLFIGQHAGGGKAEQLFLRGFDVDHGTDVSVSVDGIPVNMVSHAHGQGYADLHFLIPETIKQLDFGKGPYYTDKGNFTTAGYVDFHTRDKLDNSVFSVEAGQFNSSRIVSMFDLLNKAEKQHAYLASEYVRTDGPFDSPQHFNRFNLMGKYTIYMPKNDKLSVMASHFTSKWDASGQIPQRAVDAGLIGRFGAIDDTEGGFTSRTNLVVNHTKSIGQKAFVTSRAFYSKYSFELFSNFTFWLNDPVNGDQIRQAENRQILGLESVLHRQFDLHGAGLDFQAGAGLRYDRVLGDELSHTLNRRTLLSRMAYGDVNETNMYAFANAEFDFGSLIINPGLRIDQFEFDYVDNLAIEYQTLSQKKAVLSPKLNIVFNPTPNWQFFLKSGVGFHSNDTRVVVAQNGKEILPLAVGSDLGANWKPLPRLWLSGALWALYLEQEFVYVGDEGVVEPSGKTRRMGIDVGLRYQIADHLFFDSDINYAYARSTEAPEGADYIPLAPDLTAIGGLAFQHPSGFAGSIRYRYLKDRPANEDNSITASGYFLTDANANYSFEKITVGVVVENIFDVEWNETQFATTSRLEQEPAPVEEIHFTPGKPFFIKGRVTYKF